MANPLRGVEFLEKAAIIRDEQIDWARYLKSDDKSRIIPAEALAEKGKANLLLGPGAAQGLTLPWPKTHDKVRIQPGKVAIWAGWTHHGKTQMVKQLMLHAIGQSEKPLIASMEEEVLEVWEDLACVACGTREPSLKEIDRYIAFVSGKMWLYDQQGTVSAKRMQAVLRYAAAELKVTQAVVDSLMMLEVGRDDYEAQGAFVGELKAIAKDTGMTIHLVAHMRKRDGKAGDESPGTTHDIAGGHEIASKADYVFMPWRDKKQGANPSCVLKVDKQRGRKNWIGTVGLNFHEGSRQFVEDVHPMSFWDERGQDF
jgi:twinkle protein